MPPFFIVQPAEFKGAVHDPAHDISRMHIAVEKTLSMPATYHMPKRIDQFSALLARQCIAHRAVIQIHVQRPKSDKFTAHQRAVLKHAAYSVLDQSEKGGRDESGFFQSLVLCH